MLKIQHSSATSGKIGLAYERAAVRVETHGQQVESHLAGQLPELVAVVDRGQGVVVDDGVDRVVLVLERHVVPLGAEVVAEMARAAGLDAGEHPFPAGRVSTAGRRRSIAHRPAECTGPDFGGW